MYPNSIFREKSSFQLIVIKVAEVKMGRLKFKYYSQVNIQNQPIIPH